MSLNVGVSRVANCMLQVTNNQKWEVLMVMSRRSMLVFTLLVTLLALSAVSYAAEGPTTSDHTVTIEIPQVDYISVDEEPVALAFIDMGIELGAPEPAQSSLTFSTNASRRTIYVQGEFTPAAGVLTWPGALKLKVTPGTGSAVSIIATPTMLMSRIAQFGTVETLTYEAEADHSVRPGEYQVVVTYTISE